VTGGSQWAVTTADGMSLFQVSMKARGFEVDGQVSLAAEMFVLDVSKPRQTGSISKRRTDNRFASVSSLDIDPHRSMCLR
jgi:hypothetical protein